MKTPSTIYHNATVTRERRNQLNRHKSVVIWFTGLSGSGKSTLAHSVEEELYELGCRTFVLDGDNVRHGLSSNLTFSDDDRKENIRRIGEVAKLMMESGVIAITAFISPFREDRGFARQLLPKEDFIEIYEEDGNELPEPQKLQYASGQTRVRMPKTLHAKLRKEAVREGVSLNQQIVSLLIERLSVKEALTEIKKQLDSKAYAVKEQVVFNPEDVWSGGVLARSMVGSGSMSVTVKDVGIPKVQLTENRPDYIFKNIEHNN